MYFSDVFGLDPGVMESANVFDISLVSDLPMFIDPFLIFQSEKKEYQGLHDSIVRYVKFLQAKSLASNIAPHQMEEWFHFKEVQQNWLGFSVGTNRGHGLRARFAEGAIAGLTGPVRDFGSEAVTRGSHIERMFLFTGGTGKDGLSDFVTNLCKEFLLKFTASFAKKHLSDDHCRTMPVRRVSFDYDAERWREGTYRLPVHRTEYVLLTPADLLTHAIPWINRPELFQKFGSILDSMEDAHLRGQVNHYLAQKLAPPPSHPPNKPFKPSKQDQKEAQEEALRQYPQIANWYVREKELNGETAIEISKAKVVRAADIYKTRVIRFIDDHLRATGFFDTDQSDLGQLIEKFCDALRSGGSSLFLNNGHLVDGLSSTDVDLVLTLAWKADGAMERHMPRFAFLTDSAALTRLETKGLASASQHSLIALTQSDAVSKRLEWLCEACSVSGITPVCLCPPVKETEVENIFVSYTGSDVEWARWIGNCILSAGYKVTAQYQDFVPGANFIQEMDSAIQSTDRTIAVLSPNYLNSDFATIEWQAALREDPVGSSQKLVPVRVKKVDPKGLLGSVVYADLVGLSEESATAVLLGAIGASGRPKGNSGVFPGKRAESDQFEAIAGSPPAIHSAAKVEVPPARRLAIAQKIAALNTNKINMLIFALAPPENEVPPLNATGRERATYLLEWCLQKRMDFGELEALVDSLA